MRQFLSCTHVRYATHVNLARDRIPSLLCAHHPRSVKRQLVSHRGAFRHGPDIHRVEGTRMLGFRAKRAQLGGFQRVLFNRSRLG